MEPTPENIRFHAAGHLAAAHALAKAGQDGGARIVLGIIDRYLRDPKVLAPSLMTKMVAKASEDPGNSLNEIETLERWFVHPTNGDIERDAG